MKDLSKFLTESINPYLEITSNTNKSKEQGGWFPNCTHMILFCENGDIYWYDKELLEKQLKGLECSERDIKNVLNLKGGELYHIHDDDLIDGYTVIRIR